MYGFALSLMSGALFVLLSLGFLIVARLLFLVDALLISVDILPSVGWGIIFVAFLVFKLFLLLFWTVLSFLFDVLFHFMIFRLLFRIVVLWLLFHLLALGLL